MADLPPELERQWFTPREVGQMTGVSMDQIYIALQTGDLEGKQRKKFASWRVHRDAVDRWMGRGAA